MRPTDIVVVVRKPQDVALVVEAGTAGGWRKTITNVLGEPGAPTPAQLKRVRRSPDPRKRRLPVLVWVATAEEEALWRDAGAYAVRGTINKASAIKVFQAIARDNDWIESQVYVGPERRRRNPWLGKPVRRLADSGLMEKQSHAMVDETPFATQIRQVRLSAFGIERADRERRAHLLVDVRRAAKAADRAHLPYASGALNSLARYLAAVGAVGKLDETLVERHLEIADGPPVDAVGKVDRLVAAVSNAIGLHSAA
jgi:hypothetical protein